MTSVRISDCPPAKGIATFVATNTFFLLLLFLNFYRQNYNQKNAKTNWVNSNVISSYIVIKQLLVSNSFYAVILFVIETLIVPSNPSYSVSVYYLNLWFVLNCGCFTNVHFLMWLFLIKNRDFFLWYLVFFFSFNFNVIFVGIYTFAQLGRLRI